MKNSEKLILKIKNMVEREVSKQLKSILKEHVLVERTSLTNMGDGQLTETHNEPMDAFTQAQRALEFDRQSRLSTKPTHNLKTGNTAIDRILNETRGGIPSDSTAPVIISDGDLGLMTSKNTHAIGLGVHGSGGGLPIQTLGTNNKTLDLNNPQGRSLASALTKDYSKLMKNLS
jgi:hypothetical protein